MKDHWTNNIPEYFGVLVKAHYSAIALSSCFVVAFIAALINRELYEAFPHLSMDIKIPLNILVTSSGLAGLFAATVLSFRFLQHRHAIFGVIGFVVLMASVSFVMQKLHVAGIEPMTGPPLFGGMLLSIVFGWIFGFLLSLIDKASE